VRQLRPGIDEDAMVRAFGGDPSATALRSIAELAEELAPYHYSEVPHAVLVTRVGDRLIGVEPNGFQGSRPEAARGVSGRHRAERVLERAVPQDLVPESLVDHPALGEPFIREVLANPTADKLPAITRYLAGVVARDAGIDDVPEVRVALAALGTQAPSDPALRQRLFDLATSYEQTVGEGRETLVRLHAAQGIAGALGRPDPARASFEVYWHGGYSLRDGDDRIRNTVLGRCLKRAATFSGQHSDRT